MVSVSNALRIVYPLVRSASLSISTWNYTREYSQHTFACMWIRLHTWCRVS